MKNISNHSFRNLGRVALTAFMLLALPVAGFAQDTTGAIRGKVYDEAGSLVTGTGVVVEDMRTGLQRRYTTNDTGSFLAARLSVGGPYSVTVSGAQPVIVDSVALGDIYNLTINMAGTVTIEEIVVTATTSEVIDVATGPSATFSSFDIDTAVAFDRDIKEVYAIDPRLNLDVDGSSVNCAGQHPRFNSVTMDGVSQNDRFGLNSNGYSTATGMPFPYGGIQQIAVELSPFDATYGGFSACNVNVVSKSGTNEFRGGVFYQYTNDNYRGDEFRPLGGSVNTTIDSPAYTEETIGFNFGGPIIEDTLFFFAAYEITDEPRFLAHGPAGSTNGIERPWLSQSDFQRIVDISNNIYNYDTGGLPMDGAQENESYMVRLDWNLNDQHNASVIYNYFDGFQDRSSDSDSDEFEFANHFYRKGSISETTTLKLSSQWTDAFSTEIFYSSNTMDDSQVTVGPKDFADMQINVGGRTGTVYLGADDSRQANALNTESDFLKLGAQYLTGDHVISFGYERETLDIFNQFVQQSRGGEYDYFDDSSGNDPGCAALTAQERLDDILALGCELSGIDRFELGRPSRIYYGSGGGTNDVNDAAASFTNSIHSFYIQDEIFFDQHDLSIVGGFRYDVFTSDDRPKFNQAFTDLNGGLRNDANIDGVNLIMPRLGFSWGVRDDLSLRGGVGLYSGGNPNVWISNAWSNDGVSNVQERNNYFDSATVLPGMPDSLALSGSGQPGFDVPQEMFDAVANTTAANASDSSLVIVDPNYKQPRQWKFAFGGTYDLPWYDVAVDFDIMLAKRKDAAFYIDLSQDVVGTTTAGQPIYDYVRGRDNFMLTNSPHDANMTNLAVSVAKEFDWGLDVRAGYSYTDSEDISPMTSSVAGSNFDNTALFDVNDPRPGTSNYLVPHRFTLRAIYSRDFFGDYTSRFTAYGYYQEGQPQSYVMGSGDLEGDGFFGRHLLYVPSGPGDANVEFDPAFDQAAFFAFVAREGLSQGFQARNAQHAKWSTRWNVRIDQELPGFVEGLRGKLFLKVYNFGNMLNSDWGRQVDAQFFSLQVVDSSLNANNQYLFEEFNDRDLNDLLENRSLWEMRLGLEFNFN